MNKVILIGNVGTDPQVKTTDNGTMVANIRLATTERGYTMANGTQVPERTEWHNVILWRKLAEVVQKYVHKGDKLLIEGKIQTREYMKDNAKHYSTDIIADNMEMLSPPRQQAQAQPQTPFTRPDAPTPRPDAPIQSKTPPQADFFANDTPPF